MLQTVTFRDRLIESNILDPDGIHHEFAYHTHGVKIDFDKIAEGQPIYNDWVDANVHALTTRPTLPGAVLGIANGTNRLARDVGARLGITALQTEKISPREVILDDDSELLLDGINLDDEIVALEDVGTSGGTALTGIQSLELFGASNISALISWQRTAALASLEAAGVEYEAIIREPLPTYTPEQCRSIGYCAQGWELIAHD